jgi:hypothetical protein
MPKPRKPKSEPLTGILPEEEAASQYLKVKLLADQLRIANIELNRMVIVLDQAEYEEFLVRCQDIDEGKY